MNHFDHINMKAIIQIFSFLYGATILSNICQAADNVWEQNIKTRPYVSMGAERYKWDESVDKTDGKYVEEKGPRFHFKFGDDNFIDAQRGLLKSWDMGIVFGIVNYRGSTLDNQAEVKNGTLKGKSYYTGYSSELTRGYRYRAIDAVSFDVKQTFGGQIWLRNIRSDDVYIASNDETRQFKAVEVSVQPYVITSLASNLQITANARLSIEGGMLYPLKTWTHSNQGSVWLEPKSKLSPCAKLRWEINQNMFIEAKYLHQKYGKSRERNGELNDRTIGYYQPDTITSTLGLDVGYYF